MRNFYQLAVKFVFSLFWALSLLNGPVVALEMPLETVDAFRNTTLSEGGGLVSFGNEREVVIEFVKMNWREVLDNLDQVPSPGGNVSGAAMLVGAAAEELPPLEYLDFLDAYLTLYERGGVNDDLLRAQLAGDNRKNYFVAVNAAHPRVKALLLRAKNLVPKENVVFQEYLDEEIAGARSDMYFANASRDTPPPETLPGIKLRKPFESLIEKAKRMTRSSDEATRRNHASVADADEPGSGTEMSERGSKKGSIWLVVGALVILIIAMSKAYRKRRPVKSQGSSK